MKNNEQARKRYLEYTSARAFYQSKDSGGSIGALIGSGKPFT